MSFAPWIKIETTTPDKPEVAKMAHRLKVKDHDLIVGKLVRLFAWADANSVDGQKVSITRAFIDRLVSMKGFAHALEHDAKWISGPDDSIDFANFERHNGDSAKRRAMETRKKQDQRRGKDKDKDKDPPKAGTNVPHPSGPIRGPEEEIDSERERSGASGGDLKPPAPDPHLEWVRTLRLEYSSPILDPKERDPYHAARPLLEKFNDDDRAVIQRYLNAKHPPAAEAFIPGRRDLFLKSLSDIYGKAHAWDQKQTGIPATPIATTIPEAFTTWLADHYSLAPKSAWQTPSIRSEWEASNQDAA